MILFDDFAIGKCGNCDAYFIVDSDMVNLVDKNTWSLKMETDMFAGTRLAEQRECTHLSLNK